MNNVYLAGNCSTLNQPLRHALREVHAHLCGTINKNLFFVRVPPARKYSTSPPVPRRYKKLPAPDDPYHQHQRRCPHHLADSWRSQLCLGNC